MNQVSTIPLAQLVDSITATDQDKSDGDSHEVAEDLETPRQRRGMWRDALPFPVPPDVFECESDEDHDDDDLEGETGDGHVDGGVTAAFRGRG